MTGFDIFWRPRRPTKNNFLVKMKVSVYFWGLGIWVSSTNFWKSNIGWPQQPPSERVPYISEKLGLWWSISQRMTSIGHFGAIDDQTIRIRIFFWGNRAVKAVEAIEVAEAAEASEVSEAVEVSKAWKITTEDFRVIQVLELRFILMFWNKWFFGRLIKYQVELLQLFL